MKSDPVESTFFVWQRMEVTLKIQLSYLLADSLGEILWAWTPLTII